jgi:hypothetical protein
MTTALKSQTAPPPTAMAVKAHKQALMMSLSALKAGAVGLALASAKGDLAAKAALAALDARVRALEYEIGLNDSAVERARQEDAAAAAAWRSAVQERPAEEIIAGVGRGACPSKCQPGLHCVISGSVPHAAGTCSHPITQRHLWSRSEDGAVHYPYADNARSYELYLACCRKLKVSPS